MFVIICFESIGNN